MKRFLFLLAWIVLLAVSVPAFAADPPYAEDMQFVRDLRSRGYSDLAREYLDKLAKTAPAALKRELPLEIALTNMEAASDEPDSSKRLTLYAQARVDFEKFLRDNPGNPRAAEAQLDIARATTLQGKTQLSRALMESDFPTRIADGLKARATIVEAYNLLKKLPSTPQTELAIGLNLLDQADTYLNTDSLEELAARGKPVEEARKILEKLATGSSDDKLTWLARAWVGRCIQQLGEPKKARDKYLEITSATGAPVRDGKRLARYFLLLVAQETREAPDKQRLELYLIKRGNDWLRDYPTYAHTPEGCGLRFLLAESLLVESENPKLTAIERDRMVDSARKHLREIEQTENDFTDRAKQKKLLAMNKQGAFKQPISKLKGFEDCYVRAQYEISQISQDDKKFKDNKTQAEAARKTRIASAIEALTAALKKPIAKDESREEYNAHAMLAYYLLNEGKYAEAAKIGETFARKYPLPSQGAICAVYALLAYGEMLGKRERADADGKALQDDKAYQEEKEKMLDLARYMESRWPKERAGDLARHQIAVRLLREEKYPEAIQKLAAITPAYPSYIRTQFAFARAALQQATVDKDKGDPDGYRKRAIGALTAIPVPDAMADVDTNREFVQAKLSLASELAKDKNFDQLNAVVRELSPKLKALRLLDDPKKDEELRGKFAENLNQLTLYSMASQADGNFKKGRYAEVVKQLDPIVDAFNAGKMPEFKESDSAAFVLGLALKSNVQLNNLDRAKVDIKALQSLQSDKAGANGTTAILSQLVNLISQQVEGLRKTGDKESLKKAQLGFTNILNEVAGGQKTPTPKLGYLLAKCYSSMDEHKKAADLLKGIAAQPVGAGAPEIQLHHAIQVLLIQEYRQLKDTEKAQELLDEIIAGKDGKPGWGAKNLDAQKLRILLFEDRADYGSAALLAAKLVKQLLPRIEDNKLKEQYLELYYHETYCILKNAQGLSNPALKAKGIKNAAQRTINLEKKNGGFGSDESRKRFEELLEKEADLREQYSALKGGK